MRPAGGERGFVSIAALWFVALLALLAVSIEAWTNSSLDRGFALNRQFAAQAAIFDTTQRLIFDLVAGRLAPAGLSPPLAQAAGEPAPQSSIALDGRPYRAGDLVVRVQDEAGLCNLAGDDSDVMAKLLRNYGLSADARDAALVMLRGYIDAAGLGRSDTAAREDYSAQGLPPPRHAPLLTPWELLRIAGWGGDAVLWQSDPPLPEMVAVSRPAGINPNTAPPQIIASLPGMDSTAVSRLLAYRQTHVIAAADAIERATGIVAVDPQLGFFPSNSVRVKIMAVDAPLVRTLSVRLTPLAKAPYRVDYEAELPADAVSTGLRAPASFAALPALPGGAPPQ